ncbi:hypothetical protein [Aliicoccus persicus]|uniref:Uncharacterized protein n=1 Tax=Aliicoccus persicus TaxID=930138 RepID=A0A662Z2L8_9STAP|nr:hypothetical protein [Aliicoccus persicus]SEV82873.1 hypothetical protein SAMN05192557_0291 [Aliicoccus persicus]
MGFTRKHGALMFGTVTLLTIINLIYRVIVGDELGFMEIIMPATFMVFFLTSIIWGNEDEKNGIYQDEELGKKIIEKSSMISYFTLIFIIFIAVFADRLINDTFNVLLLVILAVAMVLQPIVQFFVMRKYK